MKRYTDNPMKRYTKEFIADNIRRAREWYTESELLDAAIERIERIERACERGFITNNEAIIETLRALHYIE